MARTLNGDHTGAELEPARWLEDLTPAQLEVARLLAAGRLNKEIARERSCSAHTVKNHVTELMARTGWGSRVELARWVWEQEGRGS